MGIQILVLNMRLFLGWNFLEYTMSEDIFSWYRKLSAVKLQLCLRQTRINAFYFDMQRQLRIIFKEEKGQQIQYRKRSATTICSSWGPIATSKVSVGFVETLGKLPNDRWIL